MDCSYLAAAWSASPSRCSASPCRTRDVNFSELLTHQLPGSAESAEPQMRKELHQISCRQVSRLAQPLQPVFPEKGKATKCELPCTILDANIRVWIGGWSASPGCRSASLPRPKGTHCVSVRMSLDQTRSPACQPHTATAAHL